MEEFAKALVQMLKDRSESKVEVIFSEVLKVNDQKLHSINLVRSDEQISRVFYIEMYYQSYLNGESLETIVDNILNIFHDEKTKLDASSIEIVNRIGDYEAIKDKLIIKLINRERNSEYLKDKVYMEYLDLAVCFCLVLEQPDDMMASIVISKALFSVWDVSVEELYEVALENMQTMLPAKITSFFDILSEMYTEFDKNPFAELLNPPELPDDVGMFIISNDKKINGATTLLYKGVIRKFAEIHQAELIYIIPSSIHELILIPGTVNTGFDVETINEMVVSVNGSEVSPMEILSDHVYVYVYDKDIIE